MRFLSLILVSALSVSASAQGILPKTFSGWTQGKVQTFTTPAAADGANAAALKEYGFHDGEQAAYTREGRTITLKALRFADGTDAFGAFTFYREPGMATEKLCDSAESAREHIVFRCADILIDAHWDRITAMTMADLRVLAQSLPVIHGPSAQGPSVPPSLNGAEDLRLSLGPTSYAHFAALPGWAELLPPAAAIDFERGAEVLLAPSDQGRGIITVVRYPTPHIAIQNLPKYEAWAKENPQPNIQALTKRSGPIVAAVRGQIGTDEAKAALEPINYEADVTWSEPTGLEKRNNIGGLVYAAIMLAIIIFGFAVIGGVFFGGFRIILRKLFPGRVVDRPEAVEFIKLNIEGGDARIDGKS